MKNKYFINRNAALVQAACEVMNKNEIVYAALYEEFLARTEYFLSNCEITKNAGVKIPSSKSEMREYFTNEELGYHIADDVASTDDNLKCYAKIVSAAIRDVVDYNFTHYWPDGYNEAVRKPKIMNCALEVYNAENWPPYDIDDKLDMSEYYLDLLNWDILTFEEERELKRLLEAIEYAESCPNGDSREECYDLGQMVIRLATKYSPTGEKANKAMLWGLMYAIGHYYGGNNLGDICSELADSMLKD